jgi:hypothetical protein
MIKEEVHYQNFIFDSNGFSYDNALENKTTFLNRTYSKLSGAYFSASDYKTIYSNIGWTL